MIFRRGAVTAPRVMVFVADKYCIGGGETPPLRFVEVVGPEVFPGFGDDVAAQGKWGPENKYRAPGIKTQQVSSRKDLTP